MNDMQRHSAPIQAVRKISIRLHICHLYKHENLSQIVRIYSQLEVPQGSILGPLNFLINDNDNLSNDLAVNAIKIIYE